LQLAVLLIFRLLFGIFYKEKTSHSEAGGIFEWNNESTFYIK